MGNRSPRSVSTRAHPVARRILHAKPGWPQSAIGPALEASGQLLFGDLARKGVPHFGEWLHHREALRFPVSGSFSVSGSFVGMSGSSAVPMVRDAGLADLRCGITAVRTAIREGRMV